MNQRPLEEEKRSASKSNSEKDQNRFNRQFNHESISSVMKSTDTD